jgi:hypothetical protein
MVSWTEIVDGKRRSKESIEWATEIFTVNRGNWQYSLQEVVRQAMSECHFQELIEGQTLNEEKSKFGTLIYYGQLMYEGRGYRIRVYFGSRQRHLMIMDEWDNGSPISKAYEKRIYREESLTSYLNELLDSIRTFWSSRNVD